jgi:hypothetical protein
MRAFAERLIALETPRNNAVNNKIPVAVLIDDKLRPHLRTLMGNVGFRALLSRALALAGAEVTWLRAVHVKADGSLEGLDGFDPPVQPAALFEGSVVLLAQLLGLLVAFIGEDLTLRFVREVWPRLSLNGLDLGAGDTDEKAS